MFLSRDTAMDESEVPLHSPMEHESFGVCGSVQNEIRCDAVENMWASW